MESGLFLDASYTGCLFHWLYVSLSCSTSQYPSFSFLVIFKAHICFRSIVSNIDHVTYCY